MIDNKITLLDDAVGVAAVDTIAEIVGLTQGAGNALHLSSGAKGIVIAGDDGANASTAYIYLIDDSVGANAGTIEADDVSIIGTIATFDIDTLTAAHFI